MTNASQPPSVPQPIPYDWGSPSFWISKTIHRLSRLKRRTLMFLAVLGPGIITMVADNDAGGISTYSITGAQYGFSLPWILPILLPVAYFIQEMTVRLGAVTKRGHAEAIFEGFGKFWGWFSIFDLAVVNWLTLVTEYIGMTAALSIFGVPPWLTFLVVTAILTAVVITGRYWTFEKITLLFCAFNLVYIPAAFWAMKNPNVPGWGAVAKGFFNPTFQGGFSTSLLFVILANIGTTITPWQVFFQQSSVVDKQAHPGQIAILRVARQIQDQLDHVGLGQHHPMGLARRAAAVLVHLFGEADREVRGERHGCYLMAATWKLAE
jgi:Mn2+/Fe2+ NRAMP family transporter